MVYFVKIDIMILQDHTSSPSIRFDSHLCQEYFISESKDMFEDIPLNRFSFSQIRITFCCTTIWLKVDGFKVPPSVVLHHLLHPYWLTRIATEPTTTVKVYPWSQTSSTLGIHCDQTSLPTKVTYFEGLRTNINKPCVLTCSMKWWINFNFS